jgi:signal transduction histidine kinase
VALAADVERGILARERAALRRLANVVKHSGASCARVEVTTGAGEVRVIVADDGAGGADPIRGSGMIGLRDRVEARGGTLTISSPVQGGTTVRAALPLRH